MRGIVRRPSGARADDRPSAVDSLGYGYGHSDVVLLFAVFAQPQAALLLPRKNRRDG